MRKFIFIIGIMFLLQLANSNEYVSSFVLNNNSAYGAITESNLQNLSKIETVQPPKEQKSEMPSVFTLMGALFSVIGLILVSGWLYSEFNTANMKKLLTKKEDINLSKFKIISTQHLGSNKSLHLIEIANRKLIIGVTANNINLISEISNNSQKNSTLAEPNNNETEAVTPDDLGVINNKDDILYKLCDVYKDYIQN